MITTGRPGGKHTTSTAAISFFMSLLSLAIDLRVMVEATGCTNLRNSEVKFASGLLTRVSVACVLPRLVSVTGAVFEIGVGLSGSTNMVIGFTNQGVAQFAGVRLRGADDEENRGATCRFVTTRRPPIDNSAGLVPLLISTTIIHTRYWISWHYLGTPTRFWPLSLMRPRTPTTARRGGETATPQPLGVNLRGVGQRSLVCFVEGSIEFWRCSW